MDNFNSLSTSSSMGGGGGGGGGVGAAKSTRENSLFDRNALLVKELHKAREENLSLKKELRRILQLRFINVTNSTCVGTQTDEMSSLRDLAREEEEQEEAAKQEGGNLSRVLFGQSPLRSLATSSSSSSSALLEEFIVPFLDHNPPTLTIEKKKKKKKQGLHDSGLESAGGKSNSSGVVKKQQQHYPFPEQVDFEQDFEQKGGFASSSVSGKGSANRSLISSIEKERDKANKSAAHSSPLRASPKKELVSPIVSPRYDREQRTTVVAFAGLSSQEVDELKRKTVKIRTTPYVSKKKSNRYSFASDADDEEEEEVEEGEISAEEGYFSAEASVDGGSSRGGVEGGASGEGGEGGEGGARGAGGGQGTRPRRGTTKPVSYKEPSLMVKVRKGFQFFKFDSLQNLSRGGDVEVENAGGGSDKKKKR